MVPGMLFCKNIIRRKRNWTFFVFGGNAGYDLKQEIGYEAAGKGHAGRIPFCRRLISPDRFLIVIILYCL